MNLILEILFVQKNILDALKKALLIHKYDIHHEHNFLIFDMKFYYYFF